MPQNTQCQAPAEERAHDITYQQILLKKWPILIAHLSLPDPRSRWRVRENGESVYIVAGSCHGRHRVQCRNTLGIISAVNETALFVHIFKCFISLHVFY